MHPFILARFYMFYLWVLYRPEIKYPYFFYMYMGLGHFLPDTLLSVISPNHRKTNILTCID